MTNVLQKNEVGSLDVVIWAVPRPKYSDPGFWGKYANVQGFVNNRGYMLRENNIFPLTSISNSTSSRTIFSGNRHGKE